MARKKKKRTHRQRVLRQARIFLKRGWWPVPIPQGRKGPRIKGWPKLRLSEEDLEDAFEPTDNIGVLLGEPSGGLVDVDVDCKEALEVAEDFLPATDRVHGRESKPDSHFWYKVTPIPSPQKFSDEDGGTLIEIRSTGQQTVIPPSFHPCGERFQWVEKGKPAHVTGENLISAVSKVAACALVARHWPRKGSRHEAAKAMAGFLLRGGWSVREVEKFVAAAARSSGRDDEWAARKGNVRTTMRRLAQGKPATGTQRLAELLGGSVIARVSEWLGLAARVEVVEAADQLLDVPSWPESPAKAAFVGLAGDIVSAIEPYTEADSAAIQMQMLLAFGNAMGRRPHVQVGADRHSGNLFSVLVGETSRGRKGLSWSVVRSLFRDADKDWEDRCVKSGLSTGEGLIWAVRDPIERLEPVKKHGRITGYQKVIADKGVEDKRLLAVEPEFAQPLKLMAREGNILSTVTRQAWDSGNLRTLTKTTPAQATGAHISVIGHITQAELRRYLSETEQGNGFGNRFLWLCVRRSKCLPEGGTVPEDDLVEIIQRLKNALRRACKVRVMKRSDKAKEMWQDIYPDLSEGAPGLLGAVTSRAEAQVTRLSMIYALMDRASIIRRRHLEAALALWRYVETSAKFVFGDALGDQVADNLWRVLRNLPEGMTRTEISRLYQGHRGKYEIDRALFVLAQSGLVTSKQESTGGRPEQRWFPVNTVAKKAKKD